MGRSRRASLLERPPCAWSKAPTFALCSPQSRTPASPAVSWRWRSLSNERRGRRAGFSHRFAGGARGKPTHPPHTPRYCRTGVAAITFHNPKMGALKPAWASHTQYGSRGHYAWLRPNVALRWRPAPTLSFTLGYGSARVEGSTPFLTDLLEGRNELIMRAEGVWGNLRGGVLTRWDTQGHTLNDLQLRRWVGAFTASSRPCSGGARPARCCWGLT